MVCPTQSPAPTPITTPAARHHQALVRLRAVDHRRRPQIRRRLALARQALQQLRRRPVRLPPARQLIPLRRLRAPAAVRQLLVRQRRPRQLRRPLHHPAGSTWAAAKPIRSGQRIAISARTVARKVCARHVDARQQNPRALIPLLGQKTNPTPPTMVGWAAPRIFAMLAAQL